MKLMSWLLYRDTKISQLEYTSKSWASYLRWIGRCNVKWLDILLLSPSPFGWFFPPPLWMVLSPTPFGWNGGMWSISQGFPDSWEMQCQCAGLGVQRCRFKTWPHHFVVFMVKILLLSQCLFPAWITNGCWKMVWKAWLNFGVGGFLTMDWHP